ncbi:hypothetical protein LTR36_000578 [Oleoguttula mirabilis]|uniref:F-box domain-containing protein n=1 Tax=Oleoguttula mirabilis TaxID=1507867 RepID=A0AAV9JPW6_9PEZI|nr:hypothetical protein LTR36_000578 [Oleoguttula mirabilis]
MAVRKRKTRDDDEDGSVKVRSPITPLTVTRLTEVKKTQKRNVVDSASTRITRNMKIDGPRKAVFNTAELLENILVFVHPKKVVAATRVCRQFRDIVATSLKLQQMLFLRLPTQTAETWRLVPSLPTDPPSGAYFDIDKGKPTSPNTRALVPVRLHPFLTLCGPKVYAGGSENSAARLLRAQGERVLFPFKKPLSGSAPWEQAPLTDPPYKTASITLYWDIKAKPLIRLTVTREVSTVTGIKLGDLQAALSYKGRTRWWSRPTNLKDMPDSTAVEVLAMLERKHGKKSVFDIESSHVVLEGVVVPTEAEWALMKESGHTRDLVQQSL